MECLTLVPLMTSYTKVLGDETAIPFASASGIGCLETGDNPLSGVT